MAGADGRNLVELWLAAGDAGDFDAFDRLLHHDVAVHAPRGLSTVGVEEEKAVWRAALEAMPDLRHTVQDAIREGDTIAVRAVVSGALQRDFAGIAASGRSFAIDQVVFAHARDGKLAEIWEVADVAGLDGR